jgi:hypothetical protein
MRESRKTSGGEAMTLRRLVAVFALVILGAVSSGAQTKKEAAAKKPTAKPPEAAGENWRVTLLDSAKYTVNRENVDPVVDEGKFNVRLELKSEYIGPPGEAEAPRLKLVAGDGKEYRAIGNLSSSGNGRTDFSAIPWLMSATHNDPDKRAVKTGDTFGPFAYFVADLPMDAKDLRLVYGDTAPLSIRPREPGKDGHVAPKPK